MSTQDHNNRNLLENRRYLRKNSTSAEVLLWTQIRSRQIEGVKFRRQFSIGPYILDFYSPEIRLCIELDGKDHFTSSGDRYDYKRTEFLKNEHNIVTIRFENKDIFNSLASVLEEIRRTIASIKTKNIYREKKCFCIGHTPSLRDFPCLRGRNKKDGQS